MTPDERELYEQERERRAMALHPYNIFLILTLVSITVLFLAFSAAYIYSRVQSQTPPVQIPVIFVLNTIILLGSSYTLTRTNKAYKDDDTDGYKQFLKYTLILSFLFLVAQIFGWWLLYQQNIELTSSTSASYLYVISIMHFLHVIAGLPFLMIFYHVAKKRMIEPVSVLVYFSDPEKRLKLRLLTLYWHFLDVLWIYLVVFFWLNYLFQ